MSGYEVNMPLNLLSASFEDPHSGIHSTRTEDGQVLSVLFDRLQIESARDDADTAPQVLRAEVVIQCRGSGWVAVEVRGATAAAGGHGYAHATGWANGRRLVPAAHAPDEPFVTSVAAPVAADGSLRLSLLLLAQRDLGSADSAAACWVDSIDIAVLPDPKARTTSK